jgi:hypothetical protein
VVYFVEEVLQVHVNYPMITGVDVTLRPKYRLVSVTVRTESITVFLKLHVVPAA